MAVPLLDIDLASAHLYLSVVELGSISKAAVRHGLSQPSASQRIRKLERQLGLTLLDRSTSGSSLTPDGHELARRCRTLVEAAEALAQDGRARRDERRLQAKVAVTSGAARHLLPSICAALATTEPLLAVEFDVARTVDACTLVRDSEADIGLVDGPDAPLSLGSEVLTTRNLTLVTGPTHPWVGRRKAVSASELARAAWAVRERGSGTRDVVLQALAGHSVDPAIQADSGDALRALVALSPNLVAAVDQTEVAEDLATGTLYSVPTSVAFVQPVRLIWSGAEARSEGARCFAHAARAAVATQKS